MFKNQILFFAMFIYSTESLSFINIEKERAKETQGFTGKFITKFDGSSGNTDKIGFGAANKLSWLTESAETLFILNYDYGESNGLKDKNKSLGHLRYSRELSAGSPLAWEVFTQAEADEFRLLQLRLLAGAGLRLKILAEKDNRLFLGYGVFHEYEKLDGFSTENTERFNMYFSWVNLYDELVSSTLSMYLQPKVDFFNDYHLRVSGSLDFLLSKTLSLGLNLSLARDNRPPGAVNANDINYSFAVKVSY